MGPYARVKRPYKDIYGENRRNNPYYEADNTMVPVLVGDQIKKVTFAKDHSSSSEKVPNGTPVNMNGTNVGVANGHIGTASPVERSAETDHAKED